MKNKPSLTAHEREFLRTNEAAREEIMQELGVAENTVIQWALYKTHVCAKNPTAMRILHKHMANPIVNAE